MDSFYQFIESLGSIAPAPGGGAAAGYSLSMGAACVEKAARFSLTDNLEYFLEKFIEVRENGILLAQEDQEKFNQWQKARKKKNKEDIDKKAVECTKVPFKVANYALSLLSTIDEFLPNCNKWLISDASAGAAHASAAFDTSVFNILINIPSIKDEHFSNELKLFLNDNVESFNQTRDVIYKKCEEIICKKAMFNLYK